MGATGGPASGDKEPKLYEVIRDQLIGEISTGRYPAGALLPSINEITVNWTVSTTTARKVLSELVAAGYARSERTRGYVSTGPRPVETPEASTGPNEGTPVPSGLVVRAPQIVSHDGGVASDRVTIDVRTERPPAEVAVGLRLEDPFAPVVVRRRLVLDEYGTAVELRTSYLESETARSTPLAESSEIPGSWLDAVSEHANARVTVVDRYFTSRHPSDSEAAALGVSLTTSVLVRVEVAARSDGLTPIDYTTTVWPGESTRVTMLGDRGLS